MNIEGCVFDLQHFESLQLLSNLFKGTYSFFQKARAMMSLRVDMGDADLSFLRKPWGNEFFKSSSWRLPRHCPKNLEGRGSSHVPRIRFLFSPQTCGNKEITPAY
jgi:hypothetical protein